MSIGRHSLKQAVRPGSDKKDARMEKEAAAVDSDDEEEGEDYEWLGDDEDLFGGDDADGVQDGQGDMEIVRGEGRDGREGPGDDDVEGGRDIPDIPDALEKPRGPRRFACRHRRRRLGIPRQPTQQEMNDHYLTHIPQKIIVMLVLEGSRWGSTTGRSTRRTEWEQYQLSVWIWHFYVDEVGHDHYLCWS